MTEALSTPPFANPPLALTVLEVRYPELTADVGPRRQSVMRELIRDRLPLIENETENQVEFAIGAAPPSFRKRTFPRFVSRDRTTALAVKEEALVLQTTSYGGWREDFRPLLETIVEAFASTSSPDGVLRIGLRYIDEIRVPSITSLPGDWREYIDHHLLAMTDEDFIPDSLSPALWQGLVQYETGAESRLTVRYGPQNGYAIDPSSQTRRRNPPTPGPFFLLDCDSYWEATNEVPEFDPGWLLEMCDGLHRPTSEYFRIVSTDKLRTEVFSSKE